MIFINMPEIMLDGPYKELTEKVGKLLQSWVDGTLDATPEISKETLDDISNELLVLDYSKDGRLSDAIILKNIQSIELSGSDISEYVSPTDFTIKMKGTSLDSETIKYLNSISKVKVK